MGVFLDLGLAAGHVCAALFCVGVRAKFALGTLPPSRVTTDKRGIGGKK